MTIRHNVANVELDVMDASTPTMFVTLDGGEQLHVTAPMSVIEPLMEAFGIIMAAPQTPDADCDDSDDGYALASAGFGTDEDYGGHH